MKVDYNEAIRFVSGNLGIKLFPHQELMLKAFCDGLNVCTGRGVGRTFVADAFGRYISYLYGRNISPDEADIVIPVRAAVHSSLMTEALSRKIIATQEQEA